MDLNLDRARNLRSTWSITKPLTCGETEIKRTNPGIFYPVELGYAGTAHFAWAKIVEQIQVGQDRVMLSSLQCSHPAPGHCGPLMI